MVSNQSSVFNLPFTRGFIDRKLIPIELKQKIMDIIII